jgi:hypothetical protein
VKPVYGIRRLIHEAVRSLRLRARVTLSDGNVIEEHAMDAGGCQLLEMTVPTSTELSVIPSPPLNQHGYEFQFWNLQFINFNLKLKFIHLSF